MSSQPWVWDAATDQYAWRPEVAAPPGQYLNSPYAPEQNSGAAHPISYPQGHPAPGLASSDLRGTHANMPNATYPPTCESSSFSNLNCPYLSTCQHLRTGLLQTTMALQSPPASQHRGAYYPSRIPRSITIVPLLLPVSQHNGVWYPKLAHKPSDRHPQHFLTHFRHLRHRLLPHVLHQFVRSSSIIFSCPLLHHRRLTHIPHVHRHWYDATAVFEIRSASVNLVSVGALNALK